MSRFFEISDKNDFVMLISGRRNSGKTYKCLQLLISDKGLKGLFDDIFIVCPTIQFNNQWKVLGDISQRNIFTEFSQELIGNLDQYFMASYRKNPDKHNLLILDDCLGSVGFSKRTYTTKLSKLVNLGRNYNVSVIILTQSFRGVPKNIRVNCDYTIFFHTANHQEFKTITDEVSVGSKKEWPKIWNSCFKERYDWMMIRSYDSSVFCNGEQINYKKEME